MKKYATITIYAKYCTCLTTPASASSETIMSQQMAKETGLGLHSLRKLFLTTQFFLKCSTISKINSSLSFKLAGGLIFHGYIVIPN